MRLLRLSALVALSLVITTTFAHVALALGAHVDLDKLTRAFVLVLGVLDRIYPPQLPPGDDHHRLPRG